MRLSRPIVSEGQRAEVVAALGPEQAPSIVRQEQPDGGPMLYRVRHTARLWRKQERPNLEQKVIEGNPAISI